MADPQAVSGSPWLTVREACEMVKVGDKLLYRAVARRELRAARLGGGRRSALRIHTTWISEWMERRSTPIEVRR